jgi:hypothetical protein
MEKITAEKVANFVFDNAEIMKRQKAMDAFEKRIGVVNGLELKKKQIELNAAKLDKMDADIFKTRTQAQITRQNMQSKLQPPQMPKMAAMPGANTGGAKPSSFETAQGGGSNPFQTSAKRGTEMRQVPQVPEAAPLQTSGSQPTGAPPMPVPPPPVQQQTSMPKNTSGVPMNMTALPKYASIKDLPKIAAAPNDGKTGFRSKNLSETIKLFPNLRSLFN